MNHLPDSFLALHSLFTSRRYECESVAEMIICFSEIKALYNELKFKIDTDNPLMLDISNFLQTKDNCMGICGEVCESLCLLPHDELSLINSRKN